jgi:hypothetical protein
VPTKPKRKPRKAPAPAAFKKPLFLKAFRDSCSLSESARIVRIDRGTHYDWLKTDPKYAANFATVLRESRDLLKDRAVSISLNGHWEPNMYQGRFQYANRKRVMCQLSDGTTAFADELPKGAKVLQRRTVTTNDGEQLGVHRVDAGMLGKLLSAWCPDEFGAKVQLTGKDGTPLIPAGMRMIFVDPDPEPDSDRPVDLSGVPA